MTLTPTTAAHPAPRPHAETDRQTLTEALFHRIRDCDDEAEIQRLRARVVAVNMEVADSLARRYYGHGESVDDLNQVAYLGLTKAVNGFNPRRGPNFLPYAVPTITGELKKHFRDRCWVVRPPRRIQDLQREISAVREKISIDLCRRPSVRELADILGVPAEDIREAMAAQGCFTPRSLDIAVTDDSATTLADLLCGGDEYQQCDTRLLLAPIMKTLSEADREVLRLRFYEEWTQERIARRFGTTQMQISRRLTRILAQLRHQLQARHT